MGHTRKPYPPTPFAKNRMRNAFLPFWFHPLAIQDDRLWSLHLIPLEMGSKDRSEINKWRFQTRAIHRLWGKQTLSSMRANILPDIGL